MVAWCSPRLLVALLLVAAAGCTDEAPRAGAGGGAAGGAGGEGGQGLPALCAAGEAPDTDDVCAPVGATACADGFAPDGLGGCAPLLPDAPCAAGQIAALGEASCRPLQDCGPAPWGHIPVDATTRYVDGSYDGGASDGTATHPFTSIADAVAVADPGDMIAITDGTYNDDFVYVSEGLRVHGRCPDRVHVDADVEIAGTGGELHGVSVTGYYGLIVSATDAWIDHVWVHDTDTAGIAVIDPFGPTFARITNTLVERTSQGGVLVVGATAELDSVWIRDIAPSAGLTGFGIGILPGLDSGALPSLLLTRSVLERLTSGGLVADGGDVVVRESVINDVSPQPANQDDGHGIAYALHDATTPGTLTIVDSVITNVHEAGVVASGCAATISGTTVVGVSGTLGGNIEPSGIATQAAGAGTIAASLLLERSTLRDTGVVGVLGVDATIEAARIHVTGTEGDGFLLLSLDGVASGSLARSLVSASGRAAVSSFGASLTLLNNQITCSPIAINAETWQGVAPLLEDLGGNRCGCDGPELCAVRSANLTPPGSLE